MLKPHFFAYSPSRINVGSFGYSKEKHDVIISPLNKVFSVDETIVDVRYLNAYFNTYRGFSDMLKYREGVEGTGRWHLEFKDMAKMLIPIPSIKEQLEIVEKIRIFDEICNEPTDGLLFEIEARQKQYEYYRDKLLSFKEKEQ